MGFITLNKLHIIYLLGSRLFLAFVDIKLCCLAYVIRQAYAVSFTRSLQMEYRNTDIIFQVGLQCWPQREGIRNRFVWVSVCDAICKLRLRFLIAVFARCRSSSMSVDIHETLLKTTVGETV